MPALNQTDNQGLIMSATCHVTKPKRKNGFFSFIKKGFDRKMDITIVLSIENYCGGD